MVQYTGREGEIPRYCCIRGMLDTGQSKCITFGGIAVDDAIREELLRVEYLVEENRVLRDYVHRFLFHSVARLLFPQRL
jgi:hypothetical protein